MVTHTHRFQPVHFWRSDSVCFYASFGQGTKGFFNGARKHFSPLLGYAWSRCGRFYRFQNLIFGNAVDFKTIAAKVLIDQFLYCVFWASPITALFYTWKEANFSLTKWKGEKTWQELFDLIIVFMVSTWLVWIPGTAIIYSLPYPLQIPLFNLTLCFFVILVSVLLQKGRKNRRQLDHLLLSA